MSNSGTLLRSRAAHDVKPRQLAIDLARRTELWQPHVRFAEPRLYHRLSAGDGWEAWLLTWLPGQNTGLHDHGGSAGAFAVLSGALRETVLLPRRDEAGDPHRSDPQRFDPLTRRYSTGSVRAFGSRHLHDVQPDGAAAVSLHVYAPRLSAMSRYSLDDGLLVRTSHERAGVDW
jgi:predicted metal-dependent enzyme (double-stranded beta helix superfamily)